MAVSSLILPRVKSSERPRGVPRRVGSTWQPWRASCTKAAARTTWPRCRTRLWTPYHKDGTENWALTQTRGYLDGPAGKNGCGGAAAVSLSTLAGHERAAPG